MNIKKVVMPQPAVIPKPWPDFPASERTETGQLPFSTALQFGESGTEHCTVITVAGFNHSTVDAYAKLLTQRARVDRLHLFPVDRLSIGEFIVLPAGFDKRKLHSMASEFGRKLKRKFSTQEQSDGSFKVTRVHRNPSSAKPAQ